MVHAQLARALTPPTIHPSATVEPGAQIAEGARIWHGAQVRAGAVIGANSVLGKGAFIDSDVRLGANCKVQNYALVYRGSILGAGVFVGPAAILTNDLYPRAITPDGQLKGGDDWCCGQIIVEDGASIGAGAIILPGVRIGRFALIGAGAVVTRDVPAHALVLGNPARQVGSVCRCGERLVAGDRCAVCGDSLAEEGV